MNIFKSFFGLLKAFKSSSLINIVGLSVALIVFFIVAIQVHYDLTYDRSYKNTDKLLQYNQYNVNTGEAGTNINFQIPARIAQAVPEIEKYCMAALWGVQKFEIDKGGTSPETYSIHLSVTTSGFCDIFTPIILSGDTTALFSQPGKAMISQRTALRVFGDENPVGKIIRFRYGKNELMIAAVYKDFPDNSSLPNGLFTHLPENDETEWSFKSYFLVSRENQAVIQEKLNRKEIIGEEWAKYNEEHPDERFELRLTSPGDLYLNNAGKGGSKRINTTYTLLAIGIITVFIAFVNFVNLSVAMAPARVRSINIRKILGVDKMKLKLTVATESVFFTLISIVIALIAIFYISTTPFAKEIFAADLSFGHHLPLLVAVSLILLISSFLVGLYTMRYCTSVDEAEALKGSFSLNKRSVKLRNALIVFQFATAISLIGVSLFIKQQNDYMLHYDWGIPKENVVYVPLAGLGREAQTFGQELLRDSRIKDYTITRDIPGRVGMSWGMEFEGKQISLTVWSVDDRFFDFFGIEILEGRKPEEMDSVVSQIVVNETFLQKYDFTNEIVGKDFDTFGPGRIQAVSKDVHFETLHQSISPMAFGVLSQWQNFNTFMIKLSGNDMKGSLDYIESTWKKFSSDPFEIHFLDAEMDNLYKTETNMAYLIAIFGLIIVAIAVMGVYGLILFDAKTKLKEIAIRKINGSTEKEILVMLNRTVLLQLCIAFFIATPVVYYTIMKWLENFSYKAPLYWWIFPLSGMIVLFIVILTVSAQSWRAATANPVDALKTE
ncbi:ABC transporter permease [Proteiniphilum sp. X52]|uniref:ABC transporter permease n=1 Tax=Proteiniphilum sp. X52 TaxID=2382159 RepID=UPI000F0A2379|nr:ABC transporter permease [Proteiniphilum sp. X52]RNC64227.1 ABC transporter permease [Proteiniphilum sp. X52]